MIVETDAGPREIIEVGRGFPVVAIRAHSVGAERVDHDVEQVDVVSRGQRTEDSLEDDGSTEVLLLYFGIATVFAGLLGLYYTHSMYMAAQPATDSQ